MPKEINVINDCNLPLPIFRAICKDDYVSRGFIGPSSLKQGIRQILGAKRFPKGKELASRKWRTFTGTLVHKGMECLLQDDPEFKTEIPLEISFNKVAKFYQLETDVTIGGTCDLLQITPDNKYIVWDYKTMATTELIKEDKKKQWEEQINIYRWLLIVTETVPRIDALFVSGFYIDWTCTKAIRSRDVNDIPCPTVSIPMWSREQVEKYIYDKVVLIQKYQDADWDSIPYCTMEERWEKPTIYKVCKYKPDGTLGNQLDGCGFPTQELANEKLYERIAKAKKDERYGIKITGGEAVMCKNYCNLSRNGYCNFLTKGESNETT